jgi:acetyl esterase/lipase
MANWRVRVAGAAVTASLLATGLGTTTAHGATPPAGASAAGQPTLKALYSGSVRSGVAARTFRYYRYYGNASSLSVYTPAKYVGKTGYKLPTVVLVHGGAWTMGDRTDMAPQAQQLARAGFLVVAVNYRLATQARWPAQRSDVSRAVTFLRQNAAFFNIDTRRMALLGSSAGGQIAAAVATQGNGNHRFKGLVVLSGLLNPLTIEQQYPDYADDVVEDKLIRCEPTDCPDRYIDAIPAMALNSSDVPSLLFHSEHEDPFGPQQATEFVNSSKAVGLSSKLKLLPGDQHGIEYWSRISATVIYWLKHRLR